MPDLNTPYLGFELSCPLVAAASPMTAELDSIRALEDAGIGAITLPSLFEEQVEHEETAKQQLRALGAAASAAAIDSIGGHSAAPSYAYGRQAEDYLEHVRATKDAVDVPVIASLNGTTASGWLRYAEMIQQAGADALELNVYYIAADPETTGAEVEQRYFDIVGALRPKLSLPLAVKIPPFFSAPAHAVRTLSRAGAGSVVLFNRFIQPDIDLASLQVRPELRLSTPDELRLTLRWMALLRGRVDCQLAATTGAHTADDVVKLLLAGADVVTMASALLKYGAQHVRSVRNRLDVWLDEHGFDAVDQLRGRLSQLDSPDPVAYERANYLKALLNYRPADE